MKLSIVIPVYRTEQTLDRCVKSILAQNLLNMEVILVDDGSPDHSPQLCNDWAARDSRIRVIHQTNAGLSAARNSGIEVATGDYLTFVDSDDFIGMDTYQPLMDYLNLHPDIDLLEYPFYWHYGAREQQVREFREKLYADATAYWLKGRAYEHTYVCNKIFHRRLFEELRFPIGRIFEDVAILPQILQKHPRIATTRQGLYHYCWNHEGITATATGSELQQLLDHHLGIMQTPEMTDDRYYMHIVNIQIDVCKLTGQQPQLPKRHVNLLKTPLSLKLSVKAILLNLIGINNLCKLYKTGCLRKKSL